MNWCICSVSISWCRWRIETPRAAGPQTWDHPGIYFLVSLTNRDYHRHSTAYRRLPAGYLFPGVVDESRQNLFLRVPHFEFHQVSISWCRWRIETNQPIVFHYQSQTGIYFLVSLTNRDFQKISRIWLPFNLVSISWCRWRIETFHFLRSCNKYTLCIYFLVSLTNRDISAFGTATPCNWKCIYFLVSLTNRDSPSFAIFTNIFLLVSISWCRWRIETITYGTCL